MERKFSTPGKIILTGEYAVVFGYPGIAIPSSLKVDIAFQESPGAKMSITWEQEHDERWDTYIQKIVALCQKKKVNSGTLTITNHIPLGSGMGSSTALVVGICKVLLGLNAEAEAREIENTLSPGNSGIDFAVIWNEQPILFSKDEGIEFVEMPNHLLDGAILIDTGTPQETTSELVAFVQQKKDGSNEYEDALKIIGHCTDRLLSGENLSSILRDHHRAQVALGVVPTPVQELIAHIEQNGGSAKVIGAGGQKNGGGIVLALDTNAHTAAPYPTFSL